MKVSDLVLNSQNIDAIVADNLCISCGTCEIACNQNAIHFVYDQSKGMIHPRIEENLCTHCEACLDVCYGAGVNPGLYSKLFGRLPKSVAGFCKASLMGYATNAEIRYSSSSGGIVTSLLKHSLESNLIDGAIVANMNPDEILYANPKIVRNANEIQLASGSKYCPIPMGRILDTIREGERYAFVGLPCHIYSVRMLAERNPQIKKAIVIYVGLFCGGMPNLLGTQFIIKSMNMDEYQLDRIEYRGSGWPGRLLLRGSKLGQIREVSVPYPEYWDSAAQYFLPLRCTLCRDGFNEFSDISCGDAWLPNIKMNDGLSLVIVRTAKGKKFLEKAVREGVVDLEDSSHQPLKDLQQGLIEMKTRKLMGRIEISKLLGRTIPEIDTDRIQKINATSIVWALDLYIGRKLASDKKLWWLFYKFKSLKKTIVNLKQVLVSRG